MLAINAVSYTQDLGPVATHTAHEGSFATSARSWFRAVFDSVVWAEANSAEKNRPATDKRRMMKRDDQSPEAFVECKRPFLDEPSGWTYLGLVYKSPGSGTRLGYGSGPYWH
jgi:hypothetical protein